MKITTQMTHEIEFSVKYFCDEEGGMRSDSYGEPKKELAEAIYLLESAKTRFPKEDWVIVCDVTTKVQAVK
jgi:hypothetical protein